MNLKILHINNYDKQGGAETVFKITRENLADFKNFSGYVKRDKTSEVPDILFSTWEDGNRLIGTINYIFSLKNYKRLSNFLHKNPVDVIHIHGFFSSLSPSVLLALKRYKKRGGVKIIQTLHDFHLVCPNSSLYNYKRNELCEKCVGKKYKLAIFKDSCDRRGRIFSVIKGVRSFVAGNILGHRKIIDKFVVPSDFLRNKLIDDGVPPHKISLIRNPVINITEANPVKEDVICYFGRFSDEKDLEFLIHAFVYWREKSSNNFKLILVGDGDKKDEIFKLISEGGYQNFIEMKPYSPFNELIEVIKSSKYFALTSKCYENFPMSVIESAALNIIPVVPNIGGMRESVEDFLKFGTTYEVGDIQSWGDSFNLLEKNYTVELEKLTERKDEILKHLYLENYLNALTEIYKNI